MRIARLRQRAAREFARYLMWFLVAYAPIAAILAFAAGVPLGGLLVFGAIFVPVMSALLTVVGAAFGAVGDPRLGGSRPYDYDPGSDPIIRSGGGYGASGDWNGYDGSGGGDGGGGGGAGG